MFDKRKAARARARRDEEWRSLVRAITDPSSAVSEGDERRFLSYLGENGRADPGSRRSDPRRGPSERFTRPAPARSEREGIRDGERVENASKKGS